MTAHKNFERTTSSIVFGIAATLKLLCNAVRSEFILPRRIPDDDSFAGAIDLLTKIGISMETIANQVASEPWKVSDWVRGKNLPPPEERLDFLRDLYAYAALTGVTCAGRRFSLTTGEEMVPAAT